MLQSEIVEPIPLVATLLAFDAYLDHVEDPLPEALIDFATLELYDTVSVKTLQATLSAPLSGDLLHAIWRNQPLPNIARVYIDYIETRLEGGQLESIKLYEDMLLIAIEMRIDDLVLVMYKHFKPLTYTSFIIMNWAIAYGDISIIIDLHNKGFKCGPTALLDAVTQNNMKIVEWLHINQPRQIAFPGVQMAVLMLHQLSPEMRRYFDGESYRLLSGMYS